MRTTSIFQTFFLNNSATSAEALVVRPPKNLRVFRCTITLTNEDPTQVSLCRIANVSDANFLSSVFLSTGYSSNTSTNLPPGTDTTTGVTNSSNSSIVLDRRGVGYMEDTFYIWEENRNGTVISFIWEGEVL